MFKNLDGEYFGIFGRQNEVIEFALSNGYAAISADLSDLVARAAASGVGFATRYLASAKSLRVGVGKLNIRLHGTEEEFNRDMETLTPMFEIIDDIRNVEDSVEGRVERASINIRPASDTLAYHENFEQHRTRIQALAERLAEKGIQLGLALDAAPSKREGKQYEFIYQAEGLLTLIKAITSDNVGLSLNTWDWLVGDGAIDQLSELGAERITSVVLSDIPAGADLTTIPSTERLMPGGGDTDFCIKVSQWLHENGYTGPLTPGPSSSQFSGSSRDAVIHKASNNIDDILIKVGALEPPTPEIEPVVEAEESEENAPEDSADTKESSESEKVSS